MPTGIPTSRASIVAVATRASVLMVSVHSPMAAQKSSATPAKMPDIRLISRQPRNAAMSAMTTGGASWSTQRMPS
ncbi:hypothetical protein D3C72_1609110 [compost metagenome]